MRPITQSGSFALHCFSILSSLRTNRYRLSECAGAGNCLVLHARYADTLLAACFMPKSIEYSTRRIEIASRDWLKQCDPKTGKSNAELVALALGKQALSGNTAAYCALRDTTEGRPAQTQQHEIISSNHSSSKSRT